MMLKFDGYNCLEYLDGYYSLGLFNATECQMLYPHENIFIDEKRNFLRIGEIYDDHDLILGYKKNENGIWGHYNNHWDGTFQFVANSLKALCEGWYQKDSTYWCNLDAGSQWNEISNFLKVNIYRYKWEAEKIQAFVDYCLSANQLTGFYVKAYKTMLGITKENGFCRRSFTNMVNINYEDSKQAFIVYFKKYFFDYQSEMKMYSFEDMEKAVEEIDEWI